MDLVFDGAVWFWKGPSPWHFVTVPDAPSTEIEAVSRTVTYGWGMIPVHARIGATEWRTSLFRQEDLYVVPVKAAVRTAEKIAVGDEVTVRLRLSP